MKKLFTLSFITVICSGLFTITSCTKDPRVITYNLDEMTACLVANHPDPNQDFTFTVDHNDAAAALSAASIDVSRVTDAKLTKIKAVITSGSTNFDKIEGIQGYLKEVGASGDGDQIFNSKPISSGAVEIAFNVNGKDFKKVLSQDMVITVKIFSKPGGNDVMCIKLTDATIEIKAKK